MWCLWRDLLGHRRWCLIQCGLMTRLRDGFELILADFMVMRTLCADDIFLIKQ